MICAINKFPLGQICISCAYGILVESPLNPDFLGNACYLCEVGKELTEEDPGCLGFEEKGEEYEKT